MAGKKMFHCIAAMDSKRGIGKNNELPWHLPKEYKHFSKTTKNVKDAGKQNAVIMGRNTWYSIPAKFRPLPGRLNIVMSNSLTSADLPDNVKLVKSLTEAVDLVSSGPLEALIEHVFIIGGQSVYKEAMASDNCDRIYLTKIEGDFGCDIFYPDIDESIFKEISLDSVSKETQEEKGVQYTFHVYSRKRLTEE